MFKRLKKELEIKIDESEGQLFLGDKKKDLRLLMLKPIDIIEFTEFAGANADDIIIWVGKTIGKDFIEKFFYEKDWSDVDLATKKETILGILEGLALLGFGFLNGTIKKDKIIVSVYNSLAEEEEENVMAKNVCLLYQGILNGVIEALGFDVEGEETECILLDDERCTFEFSLLTEEFPDNLVDEEREPEAISDFLASL